MLAQVDRALTRTSQDFTRSQTLPRLIVWMLAVLEVYARAAVRQILLTLAGLAFFSSCTPFRVPPECWSADPRYADLREYSPKDDYECPDAQDDAGWALAASALMLLMSED